MRFLPLVRRMPPLPRRRLLPVAGFLMVIALMVAMVVLPTLRPRAPWSPLAAAYRGPYGPPGGPLLFLGDSIIAAGPWSQAFPGRQVVNAGIPGDTSRDLLARLGALPPLEHTTVVLMAGINDVLEGEEAGSVADRLLLIRRDLLARGAARVVVVAPLPCGASRWGSRCLGTVAAINRRLRQEVPAADGLDLSPWLSDAAGLRHALAPDGLHPGPEGYRLWLEQLIPML